MKLGYLFVPPSGSRTTVPDRRHAGRALLAQSLGFSEFYAPAAKPCRPPRALPGPEAHPRLQILTGPATAAPPQVATGDAVSGSDPSWPGCPLTAPQAREDILLEQSQAGLLPFSVSWVGADMLSRHWSAHVTGCTYAARKASPADWRVARTVLVNDNADLAEALAKAPDSPCRSYYACALGPGAESAAVDRLIDACVLYGDPASVAQKLARLRQVSADFGTLVFVDHAWADLTRARASMVLFADVVRQSFTCGPQSGRQLELA